MNGIIIYLNILKWPYYRKRKRRIHRKSCKQQIDILRKIVQEVHPVRWSIIIIIKSKSISSLLISLYLSLFLFTEKEGNGSSSSDNFFFPCHPRRPRSATQKEFQTEEEEEEEFRVTQSAWHFQLRRFTRERKKERRKKFLLFLYVRIICELFWWFPAPPSICDPAAHPS
jgi:hypothetical protein